MIIMRTEDYQDRPENVFVLRIDGCRDRADHTIAASGTPDVAAGRDGLARRESGFIQIHVVVHRSGHRPPAAAHEVNILSEGIGMYAIRQSVGNNTESDDNKRGTPRSACEDAVDAVQQSKDEKREDDVDKCVATRRLLPRRGAPEIEGRGCEYISGIVGEPHRDPWGIARAGHKGRDGLRGT